MKKIILSVLIASVSLFAAGDVTVDAAAVYMKKCALCHGVDGRKVVVGKTLPIAGMDTTKVGKILRAYQGGGLDIYGGFKMQNILMEHRTMELSWESISAVSEYVHTLK